MTKAEIVNEIAKEGGIQKDTVSFVIEEFMKIVKKSLAKGNPVYLRGFGSFIIKHRAEKAARNKNPPLIHRWHFTQCLNS